MRKRIAFSLTALGLFVLGFGVYLAMAFVPPPPSYQDQVNSSVVAGRAWLLTQQAAGCWSSSGVTTGVTALAILAIIHSEPTGYAGLDPASKAAVDAGTTCLLNHVITTGFFAGTIDDSPGFLATYNTSISIWSLSEVPSSPAIASAIAGGRAWLIANQRNCADPAGRADAGGNQNNGAFLYEGESSPCASFYEHSNSSFALQGLAASAGGIPAATANLAQGYFTCLQRRVPHCGSSGFNPDDGGFIYSHSLNFGPVTGTAASGSGTFALLLTGVAPGDPRISDGIAFLDASLTFSPCANNDHAYPPNPPDLTMGWSNSGHDTHYAILANFKAHELAGIPPDLTNTSNYYFKLADCLTNQQAPDGHFPSSDGREDDILATSFSLLTLEKVAPGPTPTPTPTPACQTSTSISSNFNNFQINGGNYLWFSSVLKAQNLPANQTVTIMFTNQTITSPQFSQSVPKGTVIFDPSPGVTATTTFNVVTGWTTTVPSKLGGNMFLSGLNFLVPSTLPGSIHPVTWSGTISIDTPGVSVNWQWAAANYTTFNADPSLLGVKPVDDKTASQYQNSDHAGTPENYKQFVVGGGTGGGGANYTGSLSATASVCRQQ
jgi:hypothetical protein